MIGLIFIISFMVLFINVTFWEGMIFEGIGKQLKKLPEFIQKPLFDCPICMAPWWGSGILLIGQLNKLWHVNNWFEWIVVVLAAGGVNTVLIYFIEQGKTINKVLNEYDCNCSKKDMVIQDKIDKDTEARKKEVAAMRKERINKYLKK